MALNMATTDVVVGRAMCALHPNVCSVRSLLSHGLPTLHPAQPADKDRFQVTYGQ